METPEPAKENGQQSKPIPPVYGHPKFLSAPANIETLKSFFRVTGGSSLYCLSAVFIAYGIVMVLKPILAASNTLRDAVPCLLTLHVYELALLGVLLVIVFKKVVDDAVSLVILAAIFMVGTSIALGSVADRGIPAAVYWGIAGIVLVLVKIGAMRRLCHIPFKGLCIAGLVTVMAYNYFGPALMARGVSLNPTNEAARRDLWLWLYLFMLGGGMIVWMEALRGKAAEKNDRPFLQSPVRVYFWAAVIIAASGIHQYTMAYAFTLERVVLDYVPAATVVCLLVMEILRYSRKRITFIELIILSIPGVLTLYAIDLKSVLSAGKFGPELISYPPVICMVMVFITAGLAVYRQNRWLWIGTAAYGLGVVLTFGFSPQYPYDLNIFACAGILVIVLLTSGLFFQNPYVCLAGVVLLCMGTPFLDKFSEIVEGRQLTQIGAVAGIFGMGVIGIYLLFVDKLVWFVRVLGAVFLAGFILDYLPGSLHWRYLGTGLFVGLLIIVLWLRTKKLDVISILLIPFFIKAYILTKQLAAWRYVIVGFVLLAAGAVASLFKRSTTAAIESDNKKPDADSVKPPAI